MKAQRAFRLRSAKIAATVRAITTAGGLALAINFGCTDRLPVEASLNVLDPPMTVTGVDPAEGEQGDTLEVRVFGTGFENDAIPAWERDGVVDTRIGVGQVIVVSSTELRATIMIGHDAELGLRDISVRSERKKGIGSESPRAVGKELFVVNEYTPQQLAHLSVELWHGGSSYANAINSDGVIVGRSDGTVPFPGSFPVYWSAGTGAVAITEPGFAAGINNKGWIVGARRYDFTIGHPTSYHPFLFRDGVVTDLLPLQWPYESVAMAINDAGTIVGSGARDPDRDPTWPIVWQPLEDGGYGLPTPLPLRPGEEWAIGEYWEGSSAYAINARGDIAGTLELVSTRSFVPNIVAVLWRARPDGTYGLPVVLGVLDGGAESWAVSINDAGWVVGTLGGWNEPMRAVLWHPDNYHKPILLPRGMHSQTVARGINNNGEIVGSQARLQSAWAILWTVDRNGNPLTSKLLEGAAGLPNSSAWAINDAGWIVGHSRGTGPWTATLWRPDM
jgi:uncharacterized membrane protein